MAKKKSNGLPEGMVELSSRLAGFFVTEDGNALHGILEGKFINKSSKFGPKTVYKVRVLSGATRVVTKDDGEKDAAEDDLVGLDEKGYLKKLADVPEGTEIYVRCDGKEKKARVPGQSPAWTFTVATKPFGRKADKRGKSDEGEDEIPF